MSEMKNVTHRVEGSKLVIEVDLTQNFGPSASGKTNVIGSSGGFVKIDGTDGVSLSLNVCKSIPKHLRVAA